MRHLIGVQLKRLLSHSATYLAKIEVIVHRHDEMSTWRLFKRNYSSTRWKFLLNSTRARYDEASIIHVHYRSHSFQRSEPKESWQFLPIALNNGRIKCV